MATATTARKKRVRLWVDPADETTLRRAAARETVRTGRALSFSAWARRVLLAAAAGAGGSA